jgi:hypothetical protein
LAHIGGDAASKSSWLSRLGYLQDHRQALRLMAGAHGHFNTRKQDSATGYQRKLDSFSSTDRPVEGIGS